MNDDPDDEFEDTGDLDKEELKELIRRGLEYSREDLGESMFNRGALLTSHPAYKIGFQRGQEVGKLKMSNTAKKTIEGLIKIYQ